MTYTSAIQFVELASRAYGEGFINRVSVAHGISKQTVHRWSTGKREAPPKILAALREIGDVLHDQHVREQLEQMTDSWMAQGVSAYAMAGLLKDLADKIRPPAVDRENSPEIDDGI